ncbi:MAG: amino acid synthesis family protein [Paracoccaceae bacterium]
MARRADRDAGRHGKRRRLGKGAIVGEAGEKVEHGALRHAPGGYARCEPAGRPRPSKAIVPSTKKRGRRRCARLDVPVTHVMALHVRSHFDSIEVGCNDAPRAHEIALALVMTNGARHSRSGGLEAWDIKGEDGLR